MGKIAAVQINAVVLNSKEKEFVVLGVYWGDGAIRITNPRPEKYPFQFLYTEPKIFNEDDPKRLYWLAAENSEIGDLSPFRIKSMLIIVKPVKVRG